MNSEQWTTVDRYLENELMPEDPVLTALAANHAARLSAINVASNQGRQRHLLARMRRARGILEVGTLE